MTIKKTKSESNTRIAAIALAVAMLIAGFTTALLKSDRVIEYSYATVLEPAAAVPEFDLLNQDKQNFRTADFSGYWNLVFFGFSNCPDVCPTTLTKLAAASKQIRQRAGDDLKLRVVFVSVDPERDTPAVIAPYVAHFGDNIIGLTGAPAEIEKLARSLGAFYQKVQMGPDDYAVDHSAAVVVIDPDGNFHALFNAPLQSEALVTDMQTLISTW